VAALLAAPVSSTAAPHLQTVRYGATLSAGATVAWTLNQTTACGTTTGSGSQRVRLHQRGQVKLIFVRQVGGNRLLWVKVAGTPSNQIPIAGTMTRHGTVNPHPNGRCMGSPGEGPAEPVPQPDCGEKSFRGTMDVNWSPADSYPALPGEPTPLVPQVWLEEPYSTTTFRVCPFFGPQLIFRLPHAGLAEKKVFGPHAKRKLTLHPKVDKVSSEAETGPGVRWEAGVDWVLTLARLR
jgi:hypothetical protein